ncbi:uncharacterized protein P174DRAFT_516307 [Aspergillus novofumigatus IBT 16806]|uniref:Uncharacterized protein n=1 Tax=Aspergillus novofumigatus (strain IBT 16806) TaxID=1392255 RepID=A0A2I1BTI5_ASPN1|nr:uncharacterized protein P174DRAFT_516307 [Aspergillus novofumigatus IBT 16806]PKX88666.1 hypothetical protein P174DRAFT_516307 [Aspergillus novofumigatus IBT 16806]
MSTIIINRVPVSGNKDDDAGPVGDLYSKIDTGGFGLWVCAVVVLGLSAGIISKTPPGPLRSAASYNLAVSALEFFLAFSSFTKPAPARFIIILAFTTIMWGAAFPLMFVMRSDRDTYKVINLDKRVLLSIGTGVASILQNITIACGCLGVSTFIFILYQWSCVCRLSLGKFNPEEIRQAYERRRI